MRKISMILMGALLGMAIVSVAPAQQLSSIPKATLYSPNKYKTERRVGCVNVDNGPTDTRSAHCDVRYGNLWAGEELDWFQSATGEGDRSVIKDLGSYDWTAQFEIPVVVPLPKLKPGEQRNITVDTSGADGADGAPGADGDGVVRQRATPSRPKNDGKPKVDPIFARAIVGHMYVIHVVDDALDSYALFRVEALERGDNCTVSWKLIPAPAPPIN